jgi:hypothetical protein
MENPRKWEAIALMPGLSLAVERTLESLNEARRVLGMPPVSLVDNAAPRRGRPPKSVANALPVATPPAPAVERAAPRKRAMSKTGRKSVGHHTRERWALVKEAGLTLSGRSPSSADVEKAKKILARRQKAA